MKIDKVFLCNFLALVCGVWFLLTGWIWTYLSNLFLSYPVGLVGLFFWYQGKKINPTSLYNKIALIILIVGMVVSLGGYPFFS